MFSAYSMASKAGPNKIMIFLKIESAWFAQYIYSYYGEEVHLLDEILDRVVLKKYIKWPCAPTTFVSPTFKINGLPARELTFSIAQRSGTVYCNPIYVYNPFKNLF